MTVHAPTSANWHASNVDMTTVERQLSKLWADITRDRYERAVRTHVFNLVVYTPDEKTAKHVSVTLIHLAESHPSRAIIVIADRLHPQSAVDAAVSVHCHATAGGTVPLCHEQVTVTAHGRAADHVYSVVVPLLMSDLPTYLWWPGQPPFAHRMFRRLLSLASQLVIDSAQFSSPGDGFANVARISAGTHGVHDFHWARLTPWREIIAQFFDGSMWIPYASGIRKVRIEFGAGETDYSRVPAGALLLLGWLGADLSWEPETTLDSLATRDVTLSAMQGERLIEIELQFRDHGKAEAGRLMAVELVSQPKGEQQAARFSVERAEGSPHARAVSQVHDGTAVERVVPLNLKSDIELLTDELEIAGRDVLYERVAAKAAAMSGREIWLPG